jgi:hypothetical protein
MKYYATIQVEQTYEIEAENAERAEHYIRSWLVRGSPITENIDWDTLEIEEV